MLKIIRQLNKDERKNISCYYCNNPKSVKYLIKDENFIERCVCNKCVAMIVPDNEKLMPFNETIKGLEELKENSALSLQARRTIHSALQYLHNAEIDVRGKWIHLTKNGKNAANLMECSQCGTNIYYSYEPKFCPQCGSDNKLDVPH